MTHTYYDYIGEFINDTLIITRNSDDTITFNELYGEMRMWFKTYYNGKPFKKTI